MRATGPPAGSSSSGGAGPISPLQKEPAKEALGKTSCRVGRGGKVMRQPAVEAPEGPWRPLEAFGRCSPPPTAAAQPRATSRCADRLRVSSHPPQPPASANQDAYLQDVALHPFLIVIPAALGHAREHEAAVHGVGLHRQHLASRTGGASSAGSARRLSSERACCKDCSAAVQRRTPHQNSPTPWLTVWMLLVSGER